MGGGGSKESPPVQRVVTRPLDPPSSNGLTNLSVSGTLACTNCEIALETNVSTSSLKLSRDFGNFSDAECLQFERDVARIGTEISFQDFFTRLQSGGYSRVTYDRPANAEEGVPAAQFCEQVYFDEATAATITDLPSYEKAFKEGKLRSVRIRQVTGAGNFSSDTKAKFTLSLPVKFRYTAGMESVPGPSSETSMINFFGRWIPIPIPGPPVERPIVKEFQVKTMTLYHPCPVRIENVQYDAVLSLNDPGDSDTDVVVLVPLQGSNRGGDSEDFFNKFVSQVTRVTSPDPVTGLYPSADIATGNAWNIKNIFTLMPKKNPDGTLTRDPPESTNGPYVYDNPAPIANAYFSWMAAGTFKRQKTIDTPNLLQYGWVPDGRSVRYFLLANPALIGNSDLTILRRNLPQTPAEKAIHSIPNPALGSPKPLYKKTEPPALEGDCATQTRTNASQGVIREGVDDTLSTGVAALGSVFGSEDLSNILAQNEGSLEDTTDTCDPWALNAKTAVGFRITPADAAKIFFNFLTFIAVVLGVWISFYFVIKNYDFKFAEFGADAGKVIGTLALQSSGRMRDLFYKGKVAEGSEAQQAPVSRKPLSISSLRSPYGDD